MSEVWLFVLDIVILLGAAVVLGIVFERLRLGSILGYLLAGVIVGPSVTNLVQQGEAIQAIAEFGVSLLLFTIGLEFSWRQLVRFSGRALIGGAIAIGSIVLVSLLVGLAFGIDWSTAFALGAAASLGSTAVAMRVLRDKNDIDSVHGRFAVAVLLTQDIAIVPLMLVVSFAATRSGNLAASLGSAILKTALLVLGMTLFVSLVVPRLLDEKVIARNREIPILIAFATAVGSSWAAHALGLSPALGAFFAGLLLAEGRFADQMRADVLPLRTLFLTVFFVSVGLLTDVGWIGGHVFLVVGVTVGLVLSKVLVTYFSIRPFQASIVECLATAVAIAQVGEFSFVILATARDGAIVSEDMFRLATSVTLITLFATPFLTGNSRAIALRVAKVLVPRRKLAQAERTMHRGHEREGHVILVGYGAAGSATAIHLHDEGARVTVLEINPALAREAELFGMDALVGDATQTTILERAGLDTARAVVVAVPDTHVARAVVSQCKHLEPGVRVFARSRYHVFAEELQVVGADVVVDEEQSVGELLGRHVAKFLSLNSEVPVEDAGHSDR